MNRRTFIRKTGLWGLAVSFFYPLFAFVSQKRYRPPLEIRIRKRLNPGEHLVEPDFAIFETEKGPVAVSRTCTHLGCRVNYMEAEKIFLCPCHQSRFAWDGKYLSGPAKKDLPGFSVAVLEEEGGYLVQVPRGVQ